MSLLEAVVANAHRTAFALRFAANAINWTESQLRPRPSSRQIMVSGFFNEALGIGRAGTLTADALEAAGFHVFRENLRPLDRGLLTRPPIDIPDKAPVWLIHANPPEARIALLRHRYESWAGLYRIGYWAWESSEAPASWARSARWFHEIWVPSRHVADALAASFASSGLANEADKVRVVPHPVSCERQPRPHAGIRALTLFDPRSDFDRKNPAAAVDAWLLAFPEPRQGVSLVVKTLHIFNDHPQQAALRHRIAGRSDITLRSETLSDAGTLDLIADCDILLSLHRGEGFGLALAEAMAAGVCVLATGWSGNMQFMTPENALLVPYRLVPASPGHNGPRALWAEPDIASAAEALRQAVEEDALRTRLAARARADIAALRESWTSANLLG